jgi:hypothetical protein
VIGRLTGSADARTFELVTDELPSHR